MFDETAKKTLLRKIPHGLFICGVKDGDETNGFTASWVMQSSFQPPQIVVCVNAQSGSHAKLKSSGVFALSFLDSSQKEVAAKFFKPQSRVGDKLADIESFLGEETACPILKDCLGYVECKVVGAVEAGDHTVFVGEVIGAQLFRDGEPLLLEATGWSYGG
ncbi:MAG: flavin reductase family protein [Cyanobacteria bacterium J06641_5]